MQPCLSQSHSSWHHDGCRLPAVWSPQLVALECLGHICCQGMAAGMSLPPPASQRHPKSAMGSLGPHLIQSRENGQHSTAIQVRHLAPSHVYSAFLLQAMEASFNSFNRNVQILGPLFWLCQGCVLCH